MGDNKDIVESIESIDKEIEALIDLKAKEIADKLLAHCDTFQEAMDLLEDLEIGCNTVVTTKAEFIIRDTAYSKKTDCR
ncbi:hypothetical protein EP56_05530 [Listeriaceae bacterium FSL A5-0209]|nr:hypothetical protein EP56_05530 [Listeriaceae bacterium FSL A5-0209]